MKLVLFFEKRFKGCTFEDLEGGSTGVDNHKVSEKKVNWCGALFHAQHDKSIWMKNFMSLNCRENTL